MAPRKRIMENYDLAESVALLEQSVESLAGQQQAESHSLRQQIKDVLTLVERQGSEFRSEIRSITEKFSTEMKAWADRFSSSQRPNWILIIAIVGIVFTIVAGGWTIIGLQTENTVLKHLNQRETEQSSVDFAMRRDLDANSVRDAVSEKDRQGLNDRLGKTDENVRTLETSEKVVETKLGEIETQLAKDYSERNIQAAGFQRKLIEHQAALHELGASIPEMSEGPYFMPQPIQPPK